jgi:hypothetical protein
MGSKSVAALVILSALVLLLLFASEILRQRFSSVVNNFVSCVGLWL